MKKTLLLLHGALGSETELLPLKRLLDEYFHVHTFNFSGHGGEPNIQRDFTIEQFADDLRNYIQWQQFKSVNIFGYSMGGYVALYYAAVAPKKQVEKIYTLGTKFAWTPDFAAKQSRFLNPEIIEQKAPVFAQYLKSKHAPNEWNMVLEKTAQMMQQLGNNPLITEKVLGTITAKTLIAIGDQDDMVTREESENTTAQLPDATFKILRDTPHPIEKVSRSLLLDELRDFFLPD